MGKIRKWVGKKLVLDRALEFPLGSRELPGSFSRVPYCFRRLILDLEQQRLGAEHRDRLLDTIPLGC